MKRPGLTLIELLLVVGILAILASIVIIALNPPSGMPESRDVQRHKDVRDILNAVYLYAADKDELPAGIPTGTPGEICKENEDCSRIEDAVHLDILVDEYLDTIPMDPGLPSDDGTDYFIILAENGELTVSAPEAEIEEIRVSR